MHSSGVKKGCAHVEVRGVPTPEIPDWIRRAKVAGYTTAHALCPGETRLYGTEDMFGDWNGAILLLAKDFGPSRILQDRIAARDPRPYRHDEAMLANIRLRHLAAPIRDHGLLYGSALANLLRDDDRVSGPLPNRRAALEYGAQVTRWVVEHMPRLEWVVCLGSEAWHVACQAYGVGGDWRWHREEREPLGSLLAAFHPSARTTRAQQESPWETITQVVRSRACIR